MDLRLLQCPSTLPPGRTIEYCDSPYHIIFTNVNINSLLSGNVAEMPSPWRGSLAEIWMFGWRRRLAGPE